MLASAYPPGFLSLRFTFLWWYLPLSTKMASESEVPTFTSDELPWKPVQKRPDEKTSWDKAAPSDIEETGNHLVAQSLSTIIEKVDTEVEEKEKEQDEKVEEPNEKEKDGPQEEEPDFGGNEQKSQEMRDRKIHLFSRTSQAPTCNPPRTSLLQEVRLLKGRLR